MRTDSCEGEWPVSYHGTKKDNASGIAREGFLLSKGQRHMFGHGVYSSPSIDVAAGFATGFEVKGKRYQVVFQNRVSTTDLKILNDQDTHDGEYWIQPNQDLIRPYGLCIRQQKCCI